MKIAAELTVRQIMDEYMLIPMGQAALSISAILTTNEVGAFLVECLSQDISLAALIHRVTEEFEIDESTAKADTLDFLEELKKHGLLISGDEQRQNVRE